EDPGFFARHLGALLPLNSAVHSFVAENDVLKLADSFGDDMAMENSVRVRIGEGFVGRAAERRSSLTLSGKREIERALDEFSEENRKELLQLLLQHHSPAYAIVSPLTVAENVAGVVAFFFEALSDNERREWERLITLACGLFSMRMSVASLNEKNTERAPDNNLNQIVNAVNNNLAAVIGNAEILLTKNGLDNDVRAQLQSIMNEAEIASGQVRSLSREQQYKPGKIEDKRLNDLNLNEIAGQVLERSHVSENLYMIAGRAREIDFKPGDIGRLEFSGDQMRDLFVGVLNKFAALAAEEEIISIATYKRDNYVYLDISRHRRSLPPVESVAGFGNYQIPEEALKMRPRDKYLERLSGSGCRFAYDKYSSNPSYLSFKFPLRKRTEFSAKPDGSTVRILAVDDQPVILELISAMCQTLGFNVTTALSGAEALALTKENDFDVILTDLAMPGMSGLELSRLFRIDHPGTPIILITGWEATIDRDELEESGITDILYKPFRIEQLTNLVKAAATGQSA
ncbi:MAG: response regulator, partial [Candidatus Zixiibacteriota bacterium]